MFGSKVWFLTLGVFIRWSNLNYLDQWRELVDSFKLDRKFFVHLVWWESTFWAKAKKILKIICLQKETKVATKKRDNEITLNMFIRTSTRWEQGTLIKILTSRILKTEQRLGNSNILLVSALVSKYVSCIQHIWSVSEVTPHALFLSDLEVIMLLPRCCCKKSLITSDEILPWSPGARTGKTACDCHCQKSSTSNCIM